MLTRRTPLRADPDKTAEWQRRSRAANKRSSHRKAIATVSRRRRKQIADRRSVVVIQGPREPVTNGPDHAFRQWIVGLTCAVRLDGSTGSDPAHYRCKRRSGDWFKDPLTQDIRGNIMPLSHAEHAEQHQRGIETFAESRGLDLDSVCTAIGKGYQAGWTSFALSHAAREAGGYERIDFENSTIDPAMEAP